MALGTNRDYKTRARSAEKNLKRHLELMNKYIAEGFDRDTASNKAYFDVTGRNII